MPSVLICEDEAVVALDLQFILEDADFQVLGAYPSLKRAQSALESAQGGLTPDLAVLDVRLADGEVFPIAERLRAMGVGIVFHSGHLRQSEIAEDYPDAEFCMKPVAPGTLIAALERLDARKSPRLEG